MVAAQVHYNFFLYLLPEIDSFFFIKGIDIYSEKSALRTMKEYLDIKLFNESDLKSLYRSSKDFKSLEINYQALLEEKKKAILIAEIKARIAEIEAISTSRYVYR